MSTRNRGSLTVEACIVVPIVLCVMLSIVFIVKAVFVHEIIQHAITETANELSTYSYILTVSGVANIDGTISENLGEKSKNFNEHLDSYIEAYNALKEYPGSVSEKLDNGAGQLKEGDIKLEDGNEIYTSLNDVKDKIQDALTNGKEAFSNPKEELIGMISSFGGVAYDDLKGQGLSCIAGYFAAKYLKSEDQGDADKRLKSLNVVNGLNGLDFSASELFRDGKNLDIVVRYKLDLALPIKFLPDMYIVQRATVRGWMNGDNDAGFEDKKEDSDDIWAMESKARGRKIQEKYGRNLPANFPVITKMENGTAVSVKSINLKDATYTKPDNVKYKILGEIKELSDFKGKSYAGVEVKEEDIITRKLIIVVPKGEISPDIQKVLDECKSDARSKNVTLEIDQL